MNWLNDAKLSTKLITSFFLCTLITLAVGMLGISGVSALSARLQAVFNNNLVSVANTSQTKTKAVGQTRDMYRLYVATAGNAPQSLKDEFLASMKANQLASEQAFAAYRKGKLADDERIAGDQMARDWPVYQALVQRYVALMAAGDLENGRVLLLGDLQLAYRKVMDQLTIMIDSNDRQIREDAQAATLQEASARTLLYSGIVIAFIAALLLGFFISRLISRPISTAVLCAQRIAEGDLTQRITSHGRDEAGQLLQALSGMQDSLKATIQQIASAADQLASAAEELTAVTDDGPPERRNPAGRHGGDANDLGGRGSGAQCRFDLARFAIDQHAGQQRTRSGPQCGAGDQQRHSGNHLVHRPGQGSGRAGPRYRPGAGCDPWDCRTDQSAGAQRGHRGGPCGGAGAGVRGGRG